MNKKISTFLLCFVCLFVIAGCGNKLKTYKVTGTVTYKGEPVSNASVTFSPKVEGKGLVAFSYTDENGVYTLQTPEGRPGGGTTPGEYLVLIQKMELVNLGQTGVDSTGNAQFNQKVNQLLPNKYSGNESPLSATVTTSKNVFNFDLTD